MAKCSMRHLNKEMQSLTACLGIYYFQSYYALQYVAVFVPTDAKGLFWAKIHI